MTRIPEYPPSQRVTELEEQVEALEERVTELERKLPPIICHTGGESLPVIWPEEEVERLEEIARHQEQEEAYWADVNSIIPEQGEVAFAVPAPEEDL